MVDESIAPPGSDGTIESSWCCVLATSIAVHAHFTAKAMVRSISALIGNFRAVLTLRSWACWVRVQAQRPSNLRAQASLLVASSSKYSAVGLALGLVAPDAIRG